MLHAREDYNAIQPWPTKRPHNGRDADGTLVLDAPVEHADENLLPIIPDDEPVFLIRATDAIGPEAVRQWADLAERYGAESRLIEAVRGWADRMDEYALDANKHTPDTPHGLLFTEQ